MSQRMLSVLLAVTLCGCGDSDAAPAQVKTAASSCSCSPASCSVSTGDPCEQGMACDVGTLTCPGSVGWQPGYACECGLDGKAICGSPECVTPQSCACSSGMACNVKTGDACAAGLQCEGGDKICQGAVPSDYIACRCGQDGKVVCDQQQCQTADAGAGDAQVDVNPGE